MKIARMVVLANSYKIGHRCIAGIDLNTGKWIRPVSYAPERVILLPPELQGLEAREIVEVPISDTVPDPPDRFQIENRFCSNVFWKKAGKLPISGLFPYIETTPMLFYTGLGFELSQSLHQLPPSLWKSLILIRTKVRFSIADHDTEFTKKSQGVRAFFSYGKNFCYDYDLPVTDDGFLSRQLPDPHRYIDCLLTISLTRPFLEKCWKLVAGVIPLASQ